MTPDMHDDPEVLVSTGWLAARLEDPDLRVLDASWYLPSQARDAKAEYAAAHIPGAQFFDIDALSDCANPLPHMAPPPAQFAQQIGALGVGDGHHVVVYDGAGLFSAARVWWTFRLMGLRRVAVLDGGLPKWMAEGRAVSDLPSSVRPAKFTPRPDPGLVKDMSQVAAASAQGGAGIIDARPTARFRGEAAEPRPGLQSGHIPGARSLPFGQLLHPDGTMKSPQDLRNGFIAAGADLNLPQITTCGSGVTAAVLSLALQRLGHPHHALYDGSWAEWGQPGNHLIEKG